MRTRQAEVLPPSYTDATLPTPGPSLPPSYSQCVVTQEAPPRYSEVRCQYNLSAWSVWQKAKAKVWLLKFAKSWLIPISKRDFPMIWSVYRLIKLSLLGLWKYDNSRCEQLWWWNYQDRKAINNHNLLVRFAQLLSFHFAQSLGSTYCHLVIYEYIKYFLLNICAVLWQTRDDWLIYWSVHCALSIMSNRQ